MSDSGCPDRRQLVEYLQGVLPAHAAQTLDAHVAQCTTCQAALQTLNDGGSTRRPGADPPPADGLPDMSAPRTPNLGQLAEYRLLEKLGQGGMGVVYRALHTELDRIVAVKVLPLGQSDNSQIAARFRREAKAVGRLDHPNIVRALDARVTDGTRILVMELVSGLDLAELVHHVGPLAVADACALIRQAAQGLDCAHRHGLVHRDIKPSNLMLSDAGLVKMLDLGLARFREDTAQGDTTVDGQALGTPDYMAPEQVSDSHSADIRADLYSLGCTLYFLLTGGPPFGGPDYRTAFDKMTAHVHQPSPSVQDLRNDVPNALASVLNRLMAKAPEDRYATPADVVDALEPFAAQADLPALAKDMHSRQPTPAPVADPTRHRATADRSRWPRTAIAGLGVLLIILTVSVVVAYLAVRNRDVSPPDGPDSPQFANGAASDELPGWIVLSATLEGTGEADLWLLRPDGSRRIQLTQSAELYSMHPCFSPDGRRIAFVRGAPFGRSNSLWVCDTNGSAERQVVSPVGSTERFLSPVWMSDSTMCYVRDPTLDRRPDLEVWSVDVDVDQGEPQMLFRFLDAPTGDNGLVTGVSPDHRHFAVIAQSHALAPSSNVYITDRAGGLVETLWKDDPDEFQDSRALWSGSGDRVAWHHNFSRGGPVEMVFYGVGLALRGADGTWTSRLQPDRQQRVTPLAWSPGGSDLLCARMSTDETQASLFLMDDQFQAVRELFSLDVSGWRLGQRAAGRLADWALVPEDVILPAGDSR